MRALAAAAIILGLGIPARAGDRDFDAVVRGFETAFNVRRTHIPMFGLAKFLIKAARPGGAKQLDLAVFEDARIESSRIRELDATVEKAAGGRWSPMIRVREKGEWTSIYARPDGRNDIRLLIATVEPNEATIVHLKLNAKDLSRMIAESPERAGKCLGGGSDQGPERRCGE